ncbi:RNA-binding domain-containing protein [Flavitalea flava]
MPLPINIEDLLSPRAIESDRIEFKAGWNPDAIYRSICAFANDFDNTGGGYIVVGVEEEYGRPKRPVKGVPAAELAEIQKKMIGFNNLINPVYHPRLFMEEIDGVQLLIIWVTGGKNRPYQVPDQVTSKEKRHYYFIRQYANSIKANTEQSQELISLTNQIPFDDRPNRQAKPDDISPVQLQDYLRISGSRLGQWIGQRPVLEILEQMALLDGPPEHVSLRNVALLLFSEHPEKFFPYTYIDLVHFPKGVTDKQFIEKKFKGPVQQQVRQALDYIQGNLLHQLITKVDGRAEAVRVWNYPYKALEELLANCIYHRNYQEREPVTIRIEPEFILIYNLGGPDRSIRMEDFQKGQVFPKRYRNSRLGDFLKELELTEGRATGIRVIWEVLRHNGSPDPVFETDEDRSWFQVKLPIHSAFIDLVDQSIGNDVFAATSVIEELSCRLKALHLNTNLDTNLDTSLVTDQKWADFARVLIFIQTGPQKREHILRNIGLTNHSKNYLAYIEPLEKMQLVVKMIPDKPQSPRQRYCLTEKGTALLF